ncbi:MAG: Gfo/Idh/MocA family oxidoreductase [bacterium]|nr:Gfo/Idh/MocA family oxidoreductase [bacterium]
METVKWGIVGCGNVCEVKSGPGLYKAEGSELVMVMRRDGAKAEDFAKRHGVDRWSDNADEVLGDSEVNAVYIATPPSSHLELGLKVAAAGKPCLMEKPMAMNHKECVQMLEAFQANNVPLFVAYYRRALPRFLKVRELLQGGAIGTVTAVHIVHYNRLATGEKAKNWRYDPAIGGAGAFLDLASHGLDILDFLISPIRRIGGFAVNTGGAYAAEDATAASFEFESGCVGTGMWNFNADHGDNRITFTGTEGELQTPIFSDTDIVLKKDGKEEAISAPNPPHVSQPLEQTIVDELLGKGTCDSTGESGARTSWAMDQCLMTYYGTR